MKNFCICVPSGPDNINVIKEFLYLYINNSDHKGLKIPLFLICDGNEKNDFYCSSLQKDIIIINKKYNSKINILPNLSGKTGLHNVYNYFLYSCLKNQEEYFEYTVFFDSDCFILDKEWYYFILDIINNQHPDISGEFIDSFFDDNIKCYTYPRIYTPFFILKNKSILDNNIKFGRSSEINLPCVINVNKKFFCDVGSDVFLNLSQNGNTIHNTGPINNLKFINHLERISLNKERFVNSNKCIEFFDFFINDSYSPIHHPEEIELEVTSRCNLRCVQCSQSWTPDENKMDISDEVLNNMKPALSKAKAVSLHGIGEPLLANNFWEVIDAINPEAHISFHSNMTIMNKNIADKLTDGRVKLIDISLDAATEETYRKIRGANFSRVIENIKYLISVKNDNKSFLPKLRINMTLMRENIDELKDFVLLAKDLNIDTVHVWRMNEDWYPPKVSNKYFDFVYSEQTLSNHKELFNQRIKESMDLSKEIGINFILDSSLFEL